VRHDHRIWDPEKECMDREELRQLQLERLQATLNRVYKNVSFYRRRFKAIGFIPEEDFTDLDDLKKLPFTTSEDISNSYPYEMFAVPLREIVRIHSSSGTMTNPRVVGYTRQDLKTWSRLVARILTAAGVTPDDVIQITFGYGLLTGGLGIHYGAELIGASVLPTSTGRTERQIYIMRDFRTTVLVSTPSYALVIADRMNTLGIDPKTLSLRHVVCGGEPWTEEMRREIEERLFVTATDNYGVSEVMGPGVAGECLEKAGMHVQEDHFVVEVIDPQTGEVLPPGSLGELVITTLTKEAFPVVRYRTGDLCRIIDKPCACGRTTVRISRIEGRSDDVVVIKGINIVPQRIGEVLERIKGSRPPYQLVAVREGHEDHLEIRIGITEEFFFDKMRDQKTLVDEMRQKVANFIGITPRIKLVEPPSLKKDAHGKILLFVDERSQ